MLVNINKALIEDLWFWQVLSEKVWNRAAKPWDAVCHARNSDHLFYILFSLFDMNIFYSHQRYIVNSPNLWLHTHSPGYSAIDRSHAGEKHMMILFNHSAQYDWVSYYQLSLSYVWLCATVLTNPVVATITISSITMMEIVSKRLEGTTE